MKFLGQKGVIHILPLLVIIAAVGLISFLLISSTAPFGNGLFNKLNPKPTSHAATTVGRYDVLELPFTYSSTGLANPWEQVKVVANFTTPSGKIFTWPGFYYSPNDYRIRFAPAEIGNYTYTVSITGGPSGAFNTSGSFASIASTNKGFLRPSPTNPYRLMFESDNSIASLVGFNTSWDDQVDTIGVPAYSFIGGSASGGGGTEVTNAAMFQAYGISGGGYNMFRMFMGLNNFEWISSLGTPVALGGSGNVYNAQHVLLFDQLAANAHANGFHMQIGLFSPGSPVVYNTAVPSSLPTSESNAINYAFARYGAYADSWELHNEVGNGTGVPAYLSYWRNYLHSIDPYQRMVTNSFEIDQDWNWLDARSPHGSIQTTPFFLERDMTKSYTSGKPVIEGETYKTSGTSVCDPSGHRIHNWQSFIYGLVAIYWDENWMLCTNAAINVYMGQADINQNKILANAANTGFDSTAVTSTPTSSFSPSNNNALGVSALSSNKKVLIYIASNAGDTTSYTNTFSFNFPFAGTGNWIDPKTGNVLKTQAVTAGTQNITSPTFVEDMAFVITSGATPSPSVSINPTPTASPSHTPTPTQTPTSFVCQGADIDGNTKVDIFDYNILVSNFAKSGTGIQGDINGDGVVNIFDYNTLVTNFGKTGC